MEEHHQHHEHREHHVKDHKTADRKGYRVVFLTVFAGALMAEALLFMRARPDEVYASRRAPAMRAERTPFRRHQEDPFSHEVKAGAGRFPLPSRNLL